MKRTVSFVLALLLCFSLLPLSALADDSACGDDLTWSLEDGVLYISGEGEMWDFYTMHYFAEEAPAPPWFDVRDEITSVVIDEGVTSIGSEAFYECWNLEYAELPSTMERIGIRAFYACESLTELNIPESIWLIEEYAFAGCEALESVDFALEPDQIEIGEGNELLVWTYDYTKKDDADGRCGDDLTWSLEDGVLYISGEGEMWDFYAMHYFAEEAPAAPWFDVRDEITDVIMDDGVASIGNEAFYECTNLAYVDLPSTMERIGIRAFYACGSLTQIYFPESMAVVEEFAFAGCNALEYVDFEGDPSAIEIGEGNEALLIELEAPMIAANVLEPTGKPQIEWEEVEGAASYTVYYAASEKGSFTKLGTTEDTKLTHSEATAGNTYFYKVAADPLPGYRASAQSDAVSVTCTLAQPVVTLSTVASTGKIMVSWKKITGADSYSVYRYSSDTKTYTLIKKGLTGTSYTDTSKNIEPGKTYYYKVVAVGKTSAANSAQSEPKSATCKLAQPKVTVTHDAATGKPVLSWSEVDGAKSYTVLYMVGKVGPYVTLKTVTETTVTHTKAEANESYYYRVVANNAATKAESTVRSAAAQTDIVWCRLARPTVKVSVTAASGKPKLTWSEVDGARSYTVYYATSKSGTYNALKTVTGTSFTHAKAEVGKTYYYKVVANNAENVSGSYNRSVKSAVKTAVCGLARPTVKVSVTAASGKPKLTWGAVDGAKSYTVYRTVSKSGTYKAIKTVTGKTFTDTTAKAGKTYYYKVTANSTAKVSTSTKTSAYSAVRSAVCGLARPTLTAKLNTKGKPVLSWTEADGAKSYTVYYAASKTGTFKSLKTVTGTSFTHSAAEAGKTYYYKVTANSGAKPSASAVVSAYSSVKSVTCKKAASTTTAAATALPTDDTSGSTSAGTAPTSVSYDQNTTVYVSTSGHKTHLRSNCSGMKNYFTTTLGEADAQGYVRCKVCF